MITLHAQILNSSKRLSAISDSPRLDAELLLQEVLHVSKASLISRSKDELTSEQTELFEQLLTRRLAGEPIAYILGTKEFYGLSFKVTPAVLIPRPETELLVSMSYEFLHKRRGPLSIIDLGTGSGCIAVSLASELKRIRDDFRITAVDTSPSALDVARDNAKTHGMADFVTCIQGSWFQYAGDSTFDTIISNPPYIAYSDSRVSVSTKCEPKSALFSGDTGLEAYREILSDAVLFLRESGAMFLEIGEGQEDAVSQLARENFGDGVGIHSQKDLQGIIRALEIHMARTQ